MKAFSLACTIALGFSALSLAHASDALPTRQVRFADLDLSRAAGEAALYGRLVTASQSVCQRPDSAASAQNFLLRGYYRDCLRKALAGAVAQLNRAEFTAYVASRQGHSALTQIALR